MSDDPASDLRALQTRLGALSKALPGVMTGFGKTTSEATKAGGNGGMSPGFKELVAATLGVARGCEDCIVYHINAAKKHGAGRDELLGLLGVAVEMGGGPAVVYAAKALEAFDSSA